MLECLKKPQCSVFPSSRRLSLFFTQHSPLRPAKEKRPARSAAPFPTTRLFLIPKESRLLGRDDAA